MKADSFVYLNVETQRRAIDVDGWYPHKMGVSIAVALAANRLHIFTENDIQQLVPVLESARCVVGWNIKGFDFKVLAGYRSVNLERVWCLDLMEEVGKITGIRAMLSAVSAATLGTEPSTDSLELIKLWKAGKIEKVVEGCCDGVLTIKALHEYGRDHGELFYFLGSSKRRKRIKVDWTTPKKRKRPGPT